MKAEKRSRKTAGEIDRIEFLALTLKMIAVSRSKVVLAITDNNYFELMDALAELKCAQNILKTGFYPLYN
jgi:hypothetical protein